MRVDLELDLRSYTQYLPPPEDMEYWYGVHFLTPEPPFIGLWWSALV